MPIKKLNHAQILLVFVSVVYNNNFSIKIIHLKSHFFGKIDYEVYNRPIGWSILIFLSLVGLLVSHNVGSHTAHSIFIWNCFVLDTKQGRTSRKILFLGQGEFLYLTMCVTDIGLKKNWRELLLVHVHIPVRWPACNAPCY